jgi:integrase
MATARQRGEIETLASGSLRVKVYGGVDPLSGRPLYLSETVPAGPRALAEAKKVRTRLVGQVDELAR